MKSNEQEQRIILLNEYAQCLERENQAKGTEISTLHGMLQRMEQENLHLRAGLDEMRLRLEQKEKLRNASCSLQTSIDLEQRVGCVAFDACCQTREDEEYECIDQINQMLSLSQTIKEKDEIISKYHKECEEMFEAIEKLESSNRTLQERHVGDKDLMNKLEDKLRKEEQKRTNAEQRLEDISYNIYSAGEEVDNYRKQTTKLEKDIDQLITENNSLIQKVRALEREKNEYYHEIKRMSRVSFGGEGLGKSAVKKSRKVSDQRFKEIEEHLKRLQNENEAIKSNLMITR